MSNDKDPEKVRIEYQGKKYKIVEDKSSGGLWLWVGVVAAFIIFFPFSLIALVIFCFLLWQ